MASIPPPADGPLQAEILDADAPADGDEHDSETISSPTKLIRIASMVRSLLDEARRAPLDEAGRRLLAEIHHKSLTELHGVLSSDLRGELDDVSHPFESDTPSDSELRVAQAQLVGWLEGLFHGIQATLYTQQMASQQQIDEMRRDGRMLPGTEGRPPGAYI